MQEIWAIILAAGESGRMGVPKMLLPFDGTAMIEKVISNVTASKVGNIIVVVGAGKEAIIEKIGKLGVKYCYNDNYRDGMLSSVKCGFASLPSDFKAVLVFQGDQPLITPEVINAVIDTYLSSGKGIVIPVYNDRRGHPLLVDVKYRHEIEKITPDEGLHSLQSKFADDVQDVKTDEPGILRDFDTFDEYYKGINQIQ